MLLLASDSIIFGLTASTTYRYRDVSIYLTCFNYEGQILIIMFAASYDQRNVQFECVF